MIPLEAAPPPPPPPVHEEEKEDAYVLGPHAFLIRWQTRFLRILFFQWVQTKWMQTPFAVLFYSPADDLPYFNFFDLEEESGVDGEK